MKKYLLLSFWCGSVFSGFSQLTLQEGATITLAKGAVVYVAGDVISNASIKGAGTLVMNGTSLQTITMNGDSISHLEISNGSNVTLGSGSLTIDSSLSFVAGKLKLANNDLMLLGSASVTGTGASSFIWTDGTGMVKKKLNADVANFLLPLGENSNYMPAYITATGNTYSNAMLSTQLKSGSAPNIPPMIANYITNYWRVSTAGITGGTVSMKGQYNTSSVSGTENKLSGYYFNGVDWSSQSETHDYALHQVSAPVTGSGGVLFAMNKFVSVGSRAFLQGAYSATTGLMSDALRTAPRLIPLSDPYRSAPYNTTFTHVNNPVTETAADSVFQTKVLSNDNVVDWVFLQLRNTNASPGNTVLQTRSALLQRDGDIVDIDGVSPVTFNNVTNGTYAVSVRHRNHLGLSTDPSANPRTFSEARSTAFTTNAADIRTATDAQLFGTAAAYTTAAHPTLGTVNLLWGGNVNSNNSVRFQGPGNDRAAILTDLSSNELSVLTGYYRSDLNLNRTARYQGPSNDRSFLIATVLASQELNTKNEALPQ